MTDKEDILRRLYIGPAGWSYRDWAGKAYPEGGNTDHLVYTATYFNCIELNSSFYRTPSSRLIESWADRLAGRSDFRMTVKVLGRFTHERKWLPGELRRFVDLFIPLAEGGLLGAFLLQFPWSFRKDKANLRYIERLASELRDFPAVAEVRHGSWNDIETLDFLRDNGLAFCNIDQPVIGDSMPPTSYVTVPDLGYIRLHGRNYSKWFKHDAGRDDRYDYLYSSEEIEEWKDRARDIASRVGKLFIITNNHFQGQALVNSLQLRSAIEGRKVMVPPVLLKSYPILADCAEPDDDWFDLRS